MNKLTKAQKVAFNKFAINVVKFTAPALVALFSQLALGVSFKEAVPFAIIILYGLMADFFKKLPDMK